MPNGLLRHYFPQLLLTNSLDYLCPSLAFRQNIPSSFVPTYTKSLSALRGTLKLLSICENIPQARLAQESWTVEIQSGPVMVAELESTYKLGNQFSMALGRRSVWTLDYKLLGTYNLRSGITRLNIFLILSQCLYSVLPLSVCANELSVCNYSGLLQRV